MVGELSEGGRDHLLALTTDSIRSCTLAHLATAPPTHDGVRLSLRRAVRAACRASAAVTLHAAAVVIDGMGVLIPAGSGSGKSTLALALARQRGAGVVSDDIVLFDGRVVHGFGVPITIRRSSPFRALADELWYADASERLLVRPDDLDGSGMRFDSMVALIAFPRFDPCGDPEWTELSPAQAFGRLLACVVDPIDEQGWGDLTELCARTPAYQISYPDASSSVCLIELLCARPAVPLATPVPVGGVELVGASSEIRGVRFDDEVVLMHTGRGEVVVLGNCPAGAAIPLPSWSAITSGRGDGPWMAR